MKAMWLAASLGFQKSEQWQSTGKSKLTHWVSTALV
jgi:hypothetical protein